MKFENLIIIIATGPHFGQTQPHIFDCDKINIAFAAILHDAVVEPLKSCSVLQYRVPDAMRCHNLPLNRTAATRSQVSQEFTGHWMCEPAPSFRASSMQSRPDWFHLSLCILAKGVHMHSCPQSLLRFNHHHIRRCRALAVHKDHIILEVFLGDLPDEPDLRLVHVASTGCMCVARVKERKRERGKKRKVCEKTRLSA